MPVILLTDGLVFILVAMLGWLMLLVVRNPQLRTKWRKAYSQPLRMAAMVILVCYAAIGLLDSLHYRPKLSNDLNNAGNYSIKVNSVLDWLLSPNGEQMEISYSAPFATEALSQEMVKDENGNITWVTAKLTYVNESGVLAAVGLGLAYAAAAWLACVLSLWFVFVKHYKFRLHATVPWRTALVTLAVVFMIMFVCKQLMSKYHIFGTDKIGADVFYASIKSIRTGLIIGILTTLITMPFAILFGCMAGYFRGWIDDAIQYVYTILSSVPGVLLIAATVLIADAAMQKHNNLFELMAQRMDMRLLILCCVLGLTSWTSLCRILRGETLKLREHEFVLASRALGLSGLQIIIKHIVPNLLHIILISVVLDFSGLVLAEAVLSYVGVGVDPSMYSWGNMINGARMELGRDPIVWWSLTGAFVLMFTLVLTANIFADGVRDAFDPKAV